MTLLSKTKRPIESSQEAVAALWEELHEDFYNYLTGDENRIGEAIAVLDRGLWLGQLKRETVKEIVERGNYEDSREQAYKEAKK